MNHHPSEDAMKFSLILSFLVHLDATPDLRQFYFSLCEIFKHAALLVVEAFKRCSCDLSRI